MSFSSWSLENTTNYVYDQNKKLENSKIDSLLSQLLGLLVTQLLGLLFAKPFGVLLTELHVILVDQQLKVVNY